MDSFAETGGLRSGETHHNAVNASWPFAKLRASQDEMWIDVSFFVWNAAFRFVRRDIRALRRTRGAFSTGLRIEHDRADYPPWILLWTFQYGS